MDLAESERLLGTTPIGRIGFDFAGSPMVLPVTYCFVDGNVVFRTAAGLKLHAVAADHKVAFEIDSWDAVDHTGWSVLVTGQASEVVEWEERRRCEALGLTVWTGSDEERHWVCITPDHITGRRIVKVDPPR